MGLKNDGALAFRGFWRQEMLFVRGMGWGGCVEALSLRRHGWLIAALWLRGKGGVAMPLRRNGDAFTPQLRCVFCEVLECCLQRVGC